MKARTRVGVVVGRFQVTELHAGHRYLIETAIAENDVVMVVLGETGGFPTKRNPLPTTIRASIVTGAFPDVGVSVLRDTASDETWSATLDGHIEKRAGEDLTVTLYASRDGFSSSYCGKHAVKTLPEIPALSGTEMRDADANGAMAYVIDRPKEAGRFRSGFVSGLVAAQTLRLGISYQTVDVAVIRHPGREILLGQKAQDGGKLRFIGGFVDPIDASLEAAALRELREEANVSETHEMRYLGSYRIDDARYRGSEDGVLTALFVTYLMGGNVRVGDDLDAVEWVSADRLLDVVVSQHAMLARRVLEFLKRA